MKNIWTLPEKVEVDGKCYGINWDFRDILEIFSYLNDPDLPDCFRWKIALALFYKGEIPPQEQAINAFTEFVRGGELPPGVHRPKLFDWTQDAPVILAEINKIAGREIRWEKSLHWWTFLGWFHAIGDGRFSYLVGIRDKLRCGERLTPSEERFYRENRRLVQLQTPYSRREQEEKQRLLALLGESK